MRWIIHIGLLPHDMFQEIMIWQTKWDLYYQRPQGWQPILVTLYLIQYNTIHYNTILEYPYVYERRYHHHLLPYMIHQFIYGRISDEKQLSSMKGRRKCSKEVKLQTRTTMSMKTPNWTTQVLCQLVYELRCMYWAVLMKNEIWQSSILRSSASFAPQTRIN